MKNIIAVTTLLAAGAALANAEEFIWIPSASEMSTTLSGIDTTKEFSITLEYTLDTVIGSGAKSDFFSLSLTGSKSDNANQSIVFRRPLNSAVSAVVINGQDGNHYQRKDVASSLAYSMGSHVLKIVFDATNLSASCDIDGTSYSFNSFSGLGYTFDVSPEDEIGLFVNGGIEFSKVTLNYAASPSVPEPSAFGLLAGAGALALVAARRRRQKKA